jgi:hypothetical protein
MQTKKMSLAAIQGKLSRNEMKQIMAGSGGGAICKWFGTCTVYSNGTTYSGTCGVYTHSGAHPGSSASSHCMCITGLGHYTTTSGSYSCTVL